jgi:hypothetical protein
MSGSPEAGVENCTDQKSERQFPYVLVSYELPFSNSHQCHRKHSTHNDNTPEDALPALCISSTLLSMSPVLPAGLCCCGVAQSKSPTSALFASSNAYHTGNETPFRHTWTTCFHMHGQPKGQGMYPLKCLWSRGAVHDWSVR